MENFKEIAEKCLSGELSGTFIFNNEENIHSTFLVHYNIGKIIIPDYYLIFDNLVNKDGNNHLCNNNVINFIPDMQKQIKIDIPEGVEVIQEETPDGIRIKFIKKPLSYDDIENKLSLCTKIQTQYFWDSNVNECYFSKKVEVLRKLINIRNYFGKPKHFCDGVVIKCVNSYCGVETGQFYFDKPDLDNSNEVVFAKQEHAEQAIKMLGDELKYLFEPW